MERKIFLMQLENQLSYMIERIQMLVHEKDKVERTIENILIYPDLWEAYQLEQKDSIIASYEIIEKYSGSIQKLYARLQLQKTIIKGLLAKISKQRKLINQRQALKKKIKLLQSVKSHKKDLKISPQTLDQIFYIQRNKQKLYQKLNSNKKVTGLIKCFTNDSQILLAQCKNNIGLVQSTLQRWIDGKESLLQKHIQKALIMVYFSQPIQCTQTTVQKSKQREFTIQNNSAPKQCKQKRWKQYKYVNNVQMRQQVKAFLQSFYEEIQNFRRKRK